MDKRIILSIFFLFFIGLISAQPVTYITSYDEGYSIVESEHSYLKQGIDFIYNFMVYNLSTGEVLNDTSINCTFCLCDSTGNFLYNTTANSGTLEVFRVSIGGGNFSNIDHYPYRVYCQIVDGGLGGALAGDFFVTYSGDLISTSQSIVYATLIFIIVFVMISLLFFIEKLPNSNEKDEEGRILSINYLKHLRPALWLFEYFLLVALLFLSSNLAFAYLLEELFAQILFVLFKISLGLAPVIIIVWIIWIYVKMFHDFQFQRMLSRGIFPQGRL